MRQSLVMPQCVSVLLLETTVVKLCCSFFNVEFIICDLFRGFFFWGGGVFAFGSVTNESVGSQ